MVVDYRTTTSNPDIVFPSGGEDVSLSLQWVADPANMRQEADRGSVFLAGNSAGGKCSLCGDLREKDYL